MGIQMLLIKLVVYGLLSYQGLAESAEPVQRVQLTFTGDVCVGKSAELRGRFEKYYDRYGANYFFQGVEHILKRDDFTVINLENVFTERSESWPGKIWAYKTSKKYFGVISENSIEVASLANNHMQDYLQGGLEDTLSLLDQSGVKVTGYNGRLEGGELGGVTMNRIAVVEKDGIRIGILGYLGFATANVPSTKLAADIEHLRQIENVDYIVAMVHWGGQNTRVVTPKQQTEGKRLIDSGVDLVIGNHPHVLQEMTVYKNKHIYYSLGNLLFAHQIAAEMPESILVSLTLKRTQTGGLSESFRHIPIRYTGNTRINSMQPVAVWDGDYVGYIREILFPRAPSPVLIE